MKDPKIESVWDIWYLFHFQLPTATVLLKALIMVTFCRSVVLRKIINSAGLIIKRRYRDAHRRQLTRFLIHKLGEMLEDPSTFSFEICVDNKLHATNRMTNNYFSKYIVAEVSWQPTRAELVWIYGGTDPNWGGILEPSWQLLPYLSSNFTINVVD